MGNRRISSDLKDAALRMWEYGWDLEDICAALVVSPASMYRWRAIFEEIGSVVRPASGLRGRPRIIGLAAFQACHRIYAENSNTYLDELQWYLAIHHDIAISISALQATLQKAGLTRKLLHKIAAERDYERRMEYAQTVRDLKYFSGTGCEFVTVDESSKNEHTTARRYGRAPIGQRAESEDVFVRGTRYSLCAAMSVKGYIATRVIEESFDAPEYFSFIIDEVVPQMNAYPAEQSVLVMDNCRIHHSEVLKDTLNSEGIMILYLPPYSPDMNPIEESFSTWKAYLRRYGVRISAANDPVHVLLDSCGCVTADMAVGWFRNAGYIVDQ